MRIPAVYCVAGCFAALAFAAPGAAAQENYESWPVLRSTFPSTGGNGIMIKGYDPVITGGKCLTTFMAVEPGADPKVYPNFIAFEARAVQGGTLCHNGKWRAFDGGATGRRRTGCSSRTVCFAAPREMGDGMRPAAGRDADHRPSHGFGMTLFPIGHK